MGKFLLDPVKFRYERTVPNRTAETTYDLIHQWLVREAAKKIEGARPSRIKAKHGRRKVYRGWEPDAPKWLDFALHPVEGGIHVEVWAYPTRAAQAGPYQNPGAAKAGYAEALESLWKLFGYAAALPESDPEGRSWEESEALGRRDVRRGALVLLVGALVAGGGIGFNIVTGAPLVGPEWSRVVGLLVAVPLFAGVALLITGRSKIRMARKGKERLAGPRRP
ncbi:MAG TPA: hypothetical protein VGB42_03425 [Candidatus Thermoplasmatota archaeon]